MGGRFSDNLNFNCTIQELKREAGEVSDKVKKDFNCTIQELKQKHFVFFYIIVYLFQLHHTGIKTRAFRLLLYHRIFQFQLHHTGIKT